MTHLRDTEFVDFAEGTLPASRAAHLDACAKCREQAEAVSAALRESASVDIPEPSPLFWEHFSARVQEQVAGETPERAGWWQVNGVRVLMPLMAALAVVIVIVSMTLLPRLIPGLSDGAGSKATLPPAHTMASATGSGRSVGTFGTDVEAPVDDQNAEVWEVLTAAASDMGIDEAHEAGMNPRPEAVDRAVQHMNQAELTELGRLLRSEIRRSGD